MSDKEQNNIELAKNILNKTLFFNEKANGIKIKIANIPLVNLNLSVRFTNVIQKTSIKTLQDLLNTPQNELLSIRNCGKKSIRDTQNEIKFFVGKHTETFDAEFLKTYEEENDVTYFPLLGEVSNGFANNLYRIKDILLSQIDLPKRIKNYLDNNNHLKTIGDLIAVNANKIFANKNIGKTSISQIKIELEKIVNYNLPKIGILLNDPEFILDLIDGFINQLPLKKQIICILRWQNNEKLSFENIGQNFGLTRERIRQILSVIIRKLNRRILPNKRHYDHYFLNKIFNKPKAILFEDINNIPLAKRKYTQNFYLGILSELFQYVPFEGYLMKNFEQYLSRYSPSESKLAFYNAEVSKLDIPFKQITPVGLLKRIETNSSEEKLSLFYTIINSKDFWFECCEDREYFLFSRGSLYEITKNILQQRLTPLPIIEILNIIKIYYGAEKKYDSIPAVVSNLKSHKDMYQLDRYSFGLKKHFSYSRNEWEDISCEAKKRIRQIKRQANVAELYDFVKLKYPKLISKYELVYILKSDSEIIDLGWFNYSLKELGIRERIKVTDAIIELFKKNHNPKHFSEIQKEVLTKRFLRIEAMNSILKSESFLMYYGGGFHGLKKLHKNNLSYLANSESYLLKIISNDIFPKTSIKSILELFQDGDFEESIKKIIYKSGNLLLNEDSEHEPFIISKQWSVIKIVRCILSNLNRTVFFEELEWMLKDLNISTDEVIRHKIRNDKHIDYDGNKLSYIEFKLKKNDVKEIIEICYDILKSSTNPEALEEICDYINKEYVEISYDELVYILGKDDRFITIDDQMIMVK